MGMTLKLTFLRSSETAWFDRPHITPISGLSNVSILQTFQMLPLLQCMTACDIKKSFILDTEVEITEVKYAFWYICKHIVVIFTMVWDLEID